MPNVSIYQYFNKKDMDLLISLCNQYGTKFTYRKNEEIQIFGDNVSNISIIVRGILKYSIIDDQGNEYVEEFRSSGDACGDLPVNLGLINHPIIVTACSKIEIIKVNIKTFSDMLSFDEFIKVKESITQISKKIFSYYMDQAQERSVIPAEVRYQWLKEQQPEVVRHASAKDIASFLRISTEQLRRIKLKLQNSTK